MDKDNVTHPKSAPSLPLVKPVEWKETPLTSPGPQGAFLLPTGIVTLMLGDVEGSTRMWEDHPQTMAESIGSLNRIVSEAIGSHNGVRPLEQGEGDSFVAAFSRPTDAVASALEIQRELLAASIRLRIGIHTGEVHLRDASNYAGANVNRAARLRDAGHGGQVIVSAATRDLVIDEPPQGVTFVDLGTHHLKDLSRPEHVFQLLHPDLPSEFPPLRSLGTFRTNLPVQLTTFVGRTQEMVDLKQLLGQARLVTLTGTGGCGKTRLALQVAAEIVEEHPGGTWLVDLSSISEEEDIATTVAATMGVVETPLASPAERIAEHINDKKTLLLLDNCEHVLGGSASLVVELLHSAAGARILTTSREPLRAEGEIVWRVPSLQMPSTAGSGRIEGLAECEAVQLFVDRARRARHNFELTDENARAVAKICGRLDGIPLAIELAAAQVRALTPTQIESALSDRFRLLTGGARTVVPRQQTLRASVDWGHALLEDKERILLRRLAVFSGGFRLTDAEAVCAGNGLHPYEVLGSLIGLVDRSLVIMDDTGDEPRYRMLETIRSYAAERLREAEEQDEVALRHRDWYLDLLERSAPSGEPDLPAMLAIADREYANFISALEWSRAHGDVQAMARMAHLLTPYWQMHGPRAPGRDWIALGLAQRESMSPEMVAHLLADGVRLGVNPSENVSFGEEAVALAREIGDPSLLSGTLDALGMAKVFFAGGQSGLVHLEEALAVARQVDYPQAIAGALRSLATVEIWLGRFDEARSHASEALEVAGSLDDRDLAASSLFLMAQCDSLEGAIDRAVGDVERALEHSDPRNVALRTMLMATLGSFLVHRSGYDAARQVYEQVRILRAQLDQGPDHELDLIFACLKVMEGTASDEDLEVISESAHGPFWNAIEAAIDLGELDLAKTQLGQMQKRVQQTQHAIAVIKADSLAARIALLEERYRDCEELAHSALSAVQDTKMWVYLPAVVEALASATAAAPQSAQESARLMGGADAAVASMGLRRSHASLQRRADTLSRLNDSIGEEVVKQSLQQGSEMSFTELITYAQRGRGERKRPSHGWESLTPTELEVAGWVAEGLSNAQIGTKMFISTGTVRAHVSHIFIKLGLTSRTQLAAEAMRRKASPDLVGGSG